MGAGVSRRSFLRAAGLAAGAVALGGPAAYARSQAPGGLAATLPRGSVAADALPVQLARVGPVSGRQMAVVASLDNTHAVFGDGTVELLLWPGDAARLDAADIPYRILDADLLRQGRPSTDARAVGTQPGQRDAYRLPDDYATDLHALAAAHPERTRLIELPYRSLEGRPTWGLEISSNPGARDGRPVIWHDGLHHAREWPAGEQPLMWAYDLLESYGTDPRITRIVDEGRTFILPLVNIDGFIESRTALIDNSLIGNPVTGNSWHRKCMRSVTGSEEEKAAAGLNRDYYGIDLNRNYPFLWGDNAGSSSVPVDQTYRGTAPYSEPVCRNVRDLQLTHLPITAITHHTYGRLMLYAWGRNPDEVRSPDAPLMAALGDAMAAFNGYRPQQAFQLYPTSGTSRDWAHSAFSSLIYTFEHGTAFHPSYEATIPEQYAINREAYLAHAEAALDPATHVVLRGRITDTTGNPVQGAHVHVTKTFTTPTADGQDIPEEIDAWVDVAEDGSFAFHVPPSTRPHLAEERFGGPITEPWAVVATADGHEPVTIPVTAGRGEDVDLDAVTLH
jgi:hypothetical protein